MTYHQIKVLGITFLVLSQYMYIWIYWKMFFIFRWYFIQHDHTCNLLQLVGYYLTALGLAMEWKCSNEHFQNKLLECLTMPAMLLFDLKLEKFKAPCKLENAWLTYLNTTIHIQEWGLTEFCNRGRGLSAAILLGTSEAGFFHFGPRLTWIH